MKITYTQSEAVQILGQRAQEMFAGLGKIEVVIETKPETNTDLHNLLLIRGNYSNNFVVPGDKRIEAIKKLRDFCRKVENGVIIRNLGLADAKSAIFLDINRVLTYLLNHGSLDGLFNTHPS